MLDLNFSTPEEIVQRLCQRLRTERLAQEMSQADVAGRAGVGINTVSNLEAGRNVSLESLVRLAMVLVRAQEFDSLFLPKLNSLDDIRRYESSSTRKRIKRKPAHA